MNPEFDKIREIIAGQMDISQDKITMESSFTEDIGADSLDIFQIISDLEDLYKFQFTNEAAENVRTVGDAVNLIKEMNEKK